MAFARNRRNMCKWRTKWPPCLLIGQLLMTHRTQNRIFCVECSSSEETPNTPQIVLKYDDNMIGIFFSNTVTQAMLPAFHTENAFNYKVKTKQMHKQWNVAQSSHEDLFPHLTIHFQLGARVSRIPVAIYNSSRGR